MAAVGASQIVRVVDDLPPGIERLREAATAEGVRNMTALVEEWRAGRERFAEPGALFAVWLDGALAGVGGLTPQAGLAEPAIRMRRLYVTPQARRSGIGRALATTMIQQGLEAAALLTANGQASPAAPPFWLGMGFTPAPSGYDFTHWLRRT